MVAELNINFKVCVHCTTYNQSKYITDCFNGFCMQKTNFPFVCTIIDDASTDGEQTLIKQYLKDYFALTNSILCFEQQEDYAKIIFAQHKENKNCYFSVVFLKENHYSRGLSKSKYFKEWDTKASYIAICEGDDYWIDSSKLQKQFDILETHPEYSLCHHDYKLDNNGVLSLRYERVPKIMDILQIAKNNCVATQSMFYRKPSEPIIPNDFYFRYPVYQYFLNMRLAEFGDIVYIDEPLGVYRITDSGIYAKKSLKQQFTMAFGNIENMVDWYSQRVIRPDVVNEVQQRARLWTKIFVKRALRKCELATAIYMYKWGRKYWK